MFNPFRRKAADPLAKVVDRLAQALTHYEVIAQIRASAREIAGADGIAIVRREGDEIVCLTEDAVAPMWSGRRFAIESCVSGIALRDGAPLIAPDLANDPRVPDRRHLAPFIKGIAVYPISTGTNPMALGVQWYSVDAANRAALDRIAKLARAAGEALSRIDAGELQAA